MSPKKKKARDDDWEDEADLIAAENQIAPDAKPTAADDDDDDFGSKKKVIFILRAAHAHALALSRVSRSL